MKYLVVLICLLAGPAMAFQTIGSTRDISVTASATADFPVPGGRANWIWIKNDCSDDLYFDLHGTDRVADAFEYPLRLKQAEAIELEMRVAAIGVSPAAGAGACTFTVIFGR